MVWRCISRLEHGKTYCNESVTINEWELHEAIRETINRAISREQLIEALIESVRNAGMPVLMPELVEMYTNDPPELAEYDDSYTRLLLRVIRVQENTLQIVLNDGTSVYEIME
jgi:hypothetical protein